MEWGRGKVLGAAAVVAVAAGALQVTGVSGVLANAVKDTSDRGIHLVDRLFHEEDGAAHAVARAEARERTDRADRHPARAERQDDTFRWSGEIDRGDEVRILGVSGDIRAVASDGDEVVVRAEKRARNGDVSDVRIEVVEHADGVTLCAVYPGTREGRHACDREGSRRSERGRSQVSVDFEVQVPSGVRFAGRTVNGDVDAIDLDGDVEVNTVNGDVNVEALGITNAQTVNGSIDARVDGRLLGSVEFSTVNGSIELDLPDDIDADVDASWVNGSFASELPVQVQGRVSRRAQGVLGAGGPQIRLKTVNGSIQVR